MSVAQFTLAGILILEFTRLEEVKNHFRKHSPIIHVFLTLPMIIYWFLKSFFRVFARFLRKENMAAIIFASLYLLHILTTRILPSSDCSFLARERDEPYGNHDIAVILFYSRNRA